MPVLTETDRDPARGDRIKQLRVERRLTQAQLAQAVGVTGRAYYEWENRGGPMSRGNLHLLAEALDTTPAFLLTGQQFDPDLGLADRLLALEQEVEKLSHDPGYDPRPHIEALGERIDRLEQTVDRLVKAVEHGLTVLADLDEERQINEDEADSVEARRRPRRRASNGG